MPVQSCQMLKSMQRFYCWHRIHFFTDTWSVRQFCVRLSLATAAHWQYSCVIFFVQMRWMEIKTTQHFSICKWACTQFACFWFLASPPVLWFAMVVFFPRSILYSLSLHAYMFTVPIVFFFAFELVCVLTFRLTAVFKINEQIWERERERDTNIN